MDEDQSGVPLMAKKKACQSADIDKKQSFCKVLLRSHPLRLCIAPSQLAARDLIVIVVAMLRR